MLKKAYKTIQQENGTISIYGDNKWREIEYSKPEWSEEEEACFKYKGNTHFLSEYMDIHNKVHNPNPPEWMKEFNGYQNDSYFSGTLIKLDDTAESVKVYTYIS